MFTLSAAELPNEMAWGRKKKMFYDSDYVTSSKNLLSQAVLLHCVMIALSFIMQHFDHCYYRREIARRVGG